MVAGGGTIGKLGLEPGALHYADAYTPYGPIVSGPHGLNWLTLRQGSYVGGHLMPGSKDKQKQPTGRNIHAVVDLAAMGATGLARLDEKDDGVAIYRLEAVSGERLPIPAVNHGGAWLVVLGGSLLFGSKENAPIALLYANSGSTDDELVAGYGGAVVAFLSFPRLDTERGLPARDAVVAGG
jgi:hypothetical protein